MNSKLFSEPPLISVVTVVFNGKSSIEETIQSVIIQDYSRIEYIIIDGGSTDGSLSIIKKYEYQISYWISESDKGIYDAMNKAIDRVTGDWIIFLNCGDRFVSSTVISSIFNTNQGDFDIIYGDAIKEYPTFNTEWKKTELKEMWKRMPFCHQSCFVKSSLMKKYRFDTNFRLSSDFDFLYRAYQDQKRFLYVPKPISYFDNKEGASLKHAVISIKEREKIVLRDNFSLSRWTYFKILNLYVEASILVKRIIGKRTTAWVTKLLNR